MTTLFPVLLLPLTQAARPAIDAVPPPSRAAMLMAILGLVLLGLGLVACVMLGGRWVRRIAREKPRPRLEPVGRKERRAAAEAATPPGPRSSAISSERTLADSQQERETRLE